jgi:hypothetical protein
MYLSLSSQSCAPYYAHSRADFDGDGDIESLPMSPKYWFRGGFAVGCLQFSLDPVEHAPEPHLNLQVTLKTVKDYWALQMWT